MRNSWGWIFCGAFLAGPVMAAEVSIRADVWSPHNGDPKSATPGYMIEIAKAAFAAGNITVDYQTMPWERALALTREGKNDCVVGAAKTDAPDFVYPDEAQGMDQTMAFVKKGNTWRYDGIASLSAVRLGVVEGYSYVADIDSYIKANKGSTKVQAITGDTPLDQNIKKLQAGRIDAFLESKPVFNARVRELKLEQEFEFAGEAGPLTELFVACSPKKTKSKEYAQLLTKGTRLLREKGELARIMAKYGLKDWH